MEMKLSELWQQYKDPSELALLAGNGLSIAADHNFDYGSLAESNAVSDQTKLILSKLGGTRDFERASKH